MLKGPPSSTPAHSRPSSLFQPLGSSARSPGLGASRLLTSHWLRALGKQSRGRAAGQLQGRHLGGKFRGRATGGAEGGEVPGVGRPGGERASRAAGRGERAGGGGRVGESGNGGAAAEGSSSPVPSPPQLSSSRGGAGYVERGRPGSCSESGRSAAGAPAFAARGNFAPEPQVWRPRRGA